MAVSGAMSLPLIYSTLRESEVKRRRVGKRSASPGRLDGLPDRVRVASSRSLSPAPASWPELAPGPVAAAADHNNMFLLLRRHSVANQRASRPAARAAKATTTAPLANAPGPAPAPPREAPVPSDNFWWDDDDW